MSRSAGGCETLLLVEDEAVVRSLIRRVLESYGYNVLEAGNASEALAQSAHFPGSIDLLVTDVILPGGMSGRELVERLAHARPRTKVIYTSGYADDAIVGRGLLDRGVHFVKKPFTPVALARKVRQVLDEVPGERDRERDG